MPDAIARLVASNDEIAPGYALTSEEGLSGDELAKIRLWHLQAQSATIMRQTLMADAKAATVLALIGLVTTKVFLSADLGGAEVFDVVMFVNKAAVLCLCLYVIMPRFPREKDWAQMRCRERNSWAALANPQLGSYDYGEFACQADASQLFRSIARANQGAARVLLTKFKLLRVVFLLAIADVVMTITFFMGVHWA